MNLPRSRVFWAVALGHLTNDVFISMGPVLLAFLSVTIMPMTNTQIGLVVSATQLLGAVVQPGFGLIADRTGGRWLAAGGVLWTVSFLMLALVGAQTGQFWLFAVPFVMRAIGSGAFHPAGAKHSAESNINRSASSLSYFFLFGQSGLAIGPAVAGCLLDMANPDIMGLFAKPFYPVYDEVFLWSGTVSPILFLYVLVLPSFILMLMTLPTRNHYQASNGDIKSPQQTLKIPIRAITILIIMVILRSLAQPGSVTFIPVLFQNKGWSPSEYGAITSSFWIASGLAGVFFGNLADHFDRRLVMAGSMLLSAPMFFFLPLVDGPIAFVMAVAAGGLSGGSHSIIVVLAQQLIPASKGFASGAILGLIFGTGAIGNALIGIISDAIGLGTTFQLVAAAIVVASLIALALPAGKQLQSPTPEAELEPAT